MKRRHGFQDERHTEREREEWEWEWEWGERARNERQPSFEQSCRHRFWMDLETTRNFLYIKTGFVFHFSTKITCMFVIFHFVTLV